MKIDLVFYGYSNGTNYSEKFTTDNIESALDELERVTDAESVVVHINGYPFTHLASLLLRLGRPEARPHNRQELEEGVAKVAKEEAKTYKTERQKRGTQEEVAALLGVKRLAIIRRENGTRPITREAELALLALPEKRRQ